MLTAVTGSGVSDATAMAASRTDAEHFAVLYDRYAVQLYRYAHRRVGPELAEDVVAETFLAAFRRRRAYDLTRTDARPWFFGILTREIARHRRTEEARWRTIARAGGEAVAEGFAKIPGVRVVGDVTDEAGRAGVALALDEVQGFRTELIFDRQSHAYLGERSVLVRDQDGMKAGQPLNSTAVLKVAVVDRAGQLPS